MSETGGKELRGAAGRRPERDRKTRETMPGRTRDGGDVSQIDFGSGEID